MAQVVDAAGRELAFDNPSSAGAAETPVYLDEETFDKLLELMGYSASDLQIPDEAFANVEGTQGTDTLMLMDSIWKDIQEMSNRYKTFMSVDVSGLYLKSVENIIDASQQSGDAVNVR